MDYSFQPLIAKIDQFLSSPEASAFLDRYQNNVFVKKYFCDSLMKSLNEIKNELTGSMVNQIEVDELSAVLEDGFAVGFSFSNPDAFIENLYKKCETIVKLIHRSSGGTCFYFTVRRNNVLEKAIFTVNSSSGKCINDYFPSIRDELNYLMMIVKIGDCCFEVFPDANIKISRQIEIDTVRYYLNLYNRNICEVKPGIRYEIDLVPINDDYIQPDEYIFDAESDDEIILKIETKISERDTRVFKYERILLKNLKKYLSDTIAKETFKLKTLYFDSGDNSTKTSIKTIQTRDERAQTPEDMFYLKSLVDFKDGKSVRQCKHVLERVKTFMWIGIDELALTGLYDALKVTMTTTGDLQSNLLETYLRKCFEICIHSNQVYAPLTSFIQSSGFGKSKICLELLKKHAGIYMVFRKKSDTGVPHMYTWMEKFSEFVTSAPKDELPISQNDLLNEVVGDYTIGRFLSALLLIIKEYKKLFSERFSAHFTCPSSTGNTISIQEETELEVSIQEETEMEVSTQEENVTAEVPDQEVGTESSIAAKMSDQEINSMKPQLYARISKEIGEMFQMKPSDSSEINFCIDFESSKSAKFSIVLENIRTEIITFFEEYKPEDKSFPFLIFLDEADVFSEIKAKKQLGRLPAINIIRRALHLLDHTTPLMAVAIGTNSDALDFSPAVRDNSLRYTNRNNLLPPFILSGNWDIFSKLIEYEKLKFSRDVLLNLALFNVLVSFGRPLWSSCNLKDVISIAMAKLQNGDVDSLGARLAPLLVRGSFSVNSHHVLSRNLLKSYMIIVSYVSSDAKEMKVGYSSEPVLAMAARYILKNGKVRESSFRTIKEFLEKQAIDKGRIVESIFEHLVLFAVDDAEMVKITANESIAKGRNEAFEPVRKLVQCGTFLLEEQAGSNHVNNVAGDYYRVVTVKSFLSKILDQEDCSQVIEMISTEVLNGFINCSHFVQLSKLSGNDFKDIPNCPKVSGTRAKVIDKALLTCGILRQCGFVMPPGYFGIDFIIPFVFYIKDDIKNPKYSFIAFQSKTTKENVSKCAYKMAANLHLVPCAIHGDGPSDQCGPTCKAKFTALEKMEIMENQICILLSAKNSLKGTTPPKSLISLKNPSKTSTQATTKAKTETKTSAATATTTVRAGTTRTETSKDSKAQLSTWGEGSIRKSARLAEKQAGYAHQVIEHKSESEKHFPLGKRPSIESESEPEPQSEKDVVEPHSNFDDYKDVINVDEYKKYPYPLKDKTIPAKSKPDCILKKVFHNDLEVQKMIWNYECSGGKQPIKRKRILTCIALNSINAFNQVVDINTMAVILEIIEHEASNFHNVDPLHLPIVQNSMLNGTFCPYYSCNGMLRKYRGLPELGNPVESYGSVFTQDGWVKSINRCIVGPVDACLNPSELQSEYHKSVFAKLEQEEKDFEPIKLDFEVENGEEDSENEEYDDDDDEEDDEEEEDEKAILYT